MFKGAFKNLVLLTVPLGLVIGCSHTPSQRADAFSSLPAGTLTPTSDRETMQVYANSPELQGLISPVATPSGGAEDDWMLAERIRGLLTSDKTLAPHPSQVQVIVDKQTKGLVTLQGSIVTEREKQRLQDVVSQLTGVDEVDNQMTVAMPMGRGGVDTRKPLRDR